jgi:hypothetical protein
VRSVCLHTDVRNQRSQNAIRRIGGTFEGVLRSHRRPESPRLGPVQHHGGRMARRPAAPGGPDGAPRHRYCPAPGRRAAPSVAVNEPG